MSVVVDPIQYKGRMRFPADGFQEVGEARKSKFYASSAVIVPFPVRLESAASPCLSIGGILDGLRHSVRALPYTVLVIQTSTGFGAPVLNILDVGVDQNAARTRE